MALQKTIVAASGLTIPNAYIKVTNVSGAGGNATALVETFANKDAADADRARVDAPKQVAVKIDTTGASWDRQAYLQMKAMPEYQGAIDC